MSQTIYILAGPTAVGKTALALRWAREHDAEIINADALLFYRGMDIGTAKPSTAERASVPHHLIDIAAADETMSIKHYAALSGPLVDSLNKRGKRILVAGGSGFYLKSFFSAVVDTVEPSAEVQAQVRAVEAQGLSALQQALRNASPEGTGRVDMFNPRRIIRALERCLSTGRSVPQLEADFAALPSAFPQYDKRMCLLLAPNSTLHPRIEARTAAMLDNGLIDEVRTLLAQGITNNPGAAAAIGYRETIAWLAARGEADVSAANADALEAFSEAAGANGANGNPSLEALAALINLNTRRLVAKQRKWFRNQSTPDAILERSAEMTDSMLYQRLCECFS